MELKELLQYIKDAIDLETDIATQTKICDDTKQIVLSQQPQLQLLKAPDKPRGIFVEDGSDAAPAWIVGAVSCLLFGIFMLTVAVETFLVFTVVGSMLLLCFFWRKQKYRQDVAAARQKYDRMQQEYEHNLAEIKQRNSVLQNKYHNAINLWNQIYSEMEDFLTPPLVRTKELLALHYEKNIIYPKYRTLPALTSIYEYLLTGRCTELSGPHGAYNLYEDELRKDTVISQLNTVIENLEQIRHNQYMLYQQVKSIQENTSVIASELRQIKGYTVQIAQLTALNAYYAALNERNTRITMYYHL